MKKHLYIFFVTVFLSCSQDEHFDNKFEQDIDLIKLPSKGESATTNTVIDLSYYDNASDYKPSFIVANNKDSININIEFKDIPFVSDSKSDLNIYFPSSNYYYGGHDKLPSYIYKVIVPEDAINIRIENLNYTKKNYDISNNLYDKLSNRIKESLASLGKKIIYNSNNILIYEKQKYRNLTYIEIELKPYSIDLNKIEFRNKISLKLNFDSKLGFKKALVDKSNIFNKLYKKHFLNYNELVNIKKTNAIKNLTYKYLTIQDLNDPNFGINNNFYPDYLVIYADKFEGSFTNWINHRVSQEGGAHKIALVSLSSIYEVYNNTIKQEAIRNFINFVYVNWREEPSIPSFEYLMLIGDADYSFDNEDWFFPTWDSNNTNIGYTGDNKYACFESNDIPSLIIGRIAVKEVNLLSNILNKIINFETNAPLYENHFGTKNLFLAGSVKLGDTFNINGSRNILINNYQESIEYSNYESYNPNYPKFTFNEDQNPFISNFLNTSGALIFSYNGEGTVNNFYPESIYLDQVSNANLTALLVSAASLNAKFDDLSIDSYAEQWLNKTNSGALAFYGASRELNDGFSYYIDEDIISSIYLYDVHKLGAAALSSKLSYTLEFDDDRHRYNFLGDPATNIGFHISQSTKPEIKVSLNANSPRQAFLADEVLINVKIENIGLGEANNIPFSLFNIFVNNTTPIGEEEYLETIDAKNYLVITRTWSYLERFNEKFKVKVNMNDDFVDELSEYNNINQGTYYVQYPLHLNINNNTGIKKGSFEHPFTSIDEALSYINNFKRTDLITKLYIYPGTYIGSGLIYTLSNMHISAEENLNSVVIKNTYLKLIESEYGKSSINKLTFKDYNNDVPILVEGSAIIYNNLFLNNFSGFIISNYLQNNIELEVYNNIFTSNITAYTYNSDILSSNTTVNFINNVVYNNTYPFILFYGDLDTNILNLKNNIIWNNQYQTYEAMDLYLNSSYNDTNDYYLYSVGYNNMALNPLFTNPSINDFSLNLNSPCIDAGDPDIIYNDPDGSRNDMGVFGGSFNSFKNLTLINPKHDEVVYIDTMSMNPNFPVLVSLNISWVSQLIPSNSFIKLELFHYYNNEKIVDAKLEVLNSNSFDLNVLVSNNSNKYYLLISNEEEVFDFISFNLNILNTIPLHITK